MWHPNARSGLGGEGEGGERDEPAYSGSSGLLPILIIGPYQDEFTCPDCC